MVLAHSLESTVPHGREVMWMAVGACGMGFDVGTSGHREVRVERQSQPLKLKVPAG